MAQSVTDRPTPESGLIQPEHVQQMVDDLFVSMFDETVELIDGDFELADSDYLQAAIRVSGDWQAELRVIASNQLAETIAASMFGMEQSDLSKDDVFDALGEIANVIGGNVKGIVGQECSLSLPCVGELLETVQSGDISQIYRCFDHELRVSLNED